MLYLPPTLFYMIYDMAFLIETTSQYYDLLRLIPFQKGYITDQKHIILKKNDEEEVLTGVGYRHW